VKNAQSKRIVKSEVAITATNLLARAKVTLMSKDGKYPFGNMEVILSKRGIAARKRTALRTNRAR
jgi:hypothetical protein